MKNILVVDDSAFMRSILKDILMDRNGDLVISVPIEIHEADGKASALKQINKIHPDVILLDIVMQESETEGLEFICYFIFWTSIHS
jgi:CheY-like chemotaxis protein